MCSTPQFSHVATDLPVWDIEATASYFKDIPGFSIEFLWNNPPDDATVNRDGQVSFHMPTGDVEVMPETGRRAYIFLRDVDGLCIKYRQRKAIIYTPIGDLDYDMRDFDIHDANRHVLTFGTNLADQQVRN
jgi:hypothetical protein